MVFTFLVVENITYWGNIITDEDALVMDEDFENMVWAIWLVMVVVIDIIVIQKKDVVVLVILV